VGVAEVPVPTYVLRGENFEVYNSNEHERVQTLYVSLTDFQKLVIRSEEEFFIFYDGKLLGRFEDNLTLSSDSLRSAGIRGGKLAIHQSRISPGNIKVTRLVEDSRGLERRPSEAFRDFVVIAVLLITILFGVMLRLNPKLVSEFFSISKLFNLRELTDGQSHLRITSSSNILFYVFFGLLTSLYLLVIFFHLSDEFELSLSFVNSTGVYFLQWLKFTLIVILLLAFKLVLVYFLSILFGIQVIAGQHFFNWIRILLICCSVFMAVGFLYFATRGQREGFYFTMMVLLVVSMAIWALLSFFKFASKTDHSPFHLFSYICATEIIPLLIIIKVLFD